MRVLMIHNYYKLPGGEDVVYESEARLLESRGHDVIRVEFHNESIDLDRSLLDSGRLAMSTIWSRDADRKIRHAVRSHRPDIAHFHNPFPLVSLSGYAACRREGTPVVQTLHNYRLICSKAQFFRDGGVCEDCLGRRITWPGVLHGCYRGSRLMSANVSALQIAGRAIGTWTSDVDMFIATSDIVREKYVQGGFPQESIAVKPHFVEPDPGPGNHRGEYALYVGRLSPEKGVDTLLKAWDDLSIDIPLMLIGDGPLAGCVREASTRNRQIQWVGNRPYHETVEIIGDAKMLIFPSIWQEPFGRTIIEAYARGTPVLASDIGAPLDLVKSGETGMHFTAGDPQALARCVETAAADCELLAQMGCRARAEFEEHFTAERNYDQLMDIYFDVLANSTPKRRKLRRG